MRYASASTLPEPVTDWSQFTISEATRARGNVNDEPLDIDRELRGGFRRPHLVAEADGVLLALGGFRLSLSEKVALLWVRLRLETRSGHEIGSVFPQRIFQPQAFAGQFAFDAYGAILRAPVERETEGTGISAFDPVIYADRPTENSCFWDFTPIGHRAPTGCDQLAFTLRSATSATPKLLLRLMLAIAVTGTETPVYLELPPSSMRVES
jgi:hypothetical protein